MADQSRPENAEPHAAASPLASDEDPRSAELRRLDAALQQVIDERKGEVGNLDRYEDGLQELSKLIHQVNNPLTSLLGRAQILRLGGDLDPGVAKATDVIEESALRIADDVKAISRVVQTLRETTRSRRAAIAADTDESA